MTAELPKAIKWNEPCPYPYALILAGESLYAGGEGKVAAISTRTGKPVWTAEIEGKAYGLAVAGGALYVSTDEGRIHCFRERPVRISSARRY